MRHRSYFAALAALLMLTATACGAKKEETAVMTNAEPAVVDAVPDAADNADDAAPAEAAPEAEDGGISYDMDAEGAAADMPAIYADREALAGAASMDGASYKRDAMTAGEAVMEAGAPAAEDMKTPDDEIMPDPDVEPDIVEKRPEAGLLTAGEWRDHENWGFFSNLVNTGKIAFPSFGIDPCHRVSVELKDGAGSPLANANVTLLDADGNEIWKSVTDKNGTAYLFETNDRHAVSVKAVSGSAEMTEEVPAAANTSGTQSEEAVCTDRSVSLTLDAGASAYSKTQVMFIVDTTGSMGDEMLYLQSDFASIAEEVGDAQTEYSALFYKDEGDIYVTRGEGFTSDVSAIKKQLGKESADGGGDEPEAVAEAFTEAFVSENWADDAVKVAFLIYDAPPHDDKSKELQTAIEAASEKGIHLVPVVSSNGSRETELFGRACAICTNGSYVFLTDDSGIGGSHLEPIIGDYEVEKLHDIIVRIIQEYKQG